MAYEIDLSNQTALVTGGIQSIGLGISTVLASAGANVIICDILPAADERVKAGLQAVKAAASGQISYLQKDLSKVENCKAMVDEAAAITGDLHILVNNVAVVGKGGDWNKAFDVNVRGMYDTCERAKPYLKRSGGRIVIITSASVLTGGTGIPEYIASKGGTSAMIRYIAREYAPLGIRVNGVAPAVIMTEMTLTRFGSEEAMQKHYEGKLPLNRIGTIEDVANAVIYLASDKSQWTCGETLLLDGGRLYLK